VVGWEAGEKPSLAERTVFGDLIHSFDYSSFNAQPQAPAHLARTEQAGVCGWALNEGSHARLEFRRDDVAQRHRFRFSCAAAGMPATWR